MIRVNLAKKTLTTLKVSYHLDEFNVESMASV